MRWLDERESHLWRSWLQVHQGLSDALAEQLSHESGLSAADYAVLVPPSEAPRGLLRARELGQAILWGRDRLSHHVRRMEQRGLIVREDCEDDARGSMIRLTPAGRAAIKRAAPSHVAATRRYFIDVLSDDEVEMLAAICDRVLERLSRDSTEEAERRSPPTSTPGRRTARSATSIPRGRR